MKKTVILILTAFMLMGLFGCSKPQEEFSSPLKDSFTAAYTEEPKSMDYLVSTSAADEFFNVNYVDGLLELSQSWDSNSDDTVFTFHLRKGVQWTDSTAEPYGEVKADDFVAALQHVLDFNSQRARAAVDMIVNAEAYRNGDITDFSMVGVKALDDYTVEYTLKNSYPDFDDLLDDMAFCPVNRDFLESKGPGCKLGAPEQQSCQFGTIDYDSILYNGAFIPTQLVEKMVIELRASDKYWDSDSVSLKKCTFYYEDGNDPYALIKGFEQGLYDECVVDHRWDDFHVYAEKYADCLFLSQAGRKTLGLVLNMNREDYTTASNDSDEKKLNAYQALLNSSFRKGLQASIDKKAVLSAAYPEEIAAAMVRNEIMNLPLVSHNADLLDELNKVELDRDKLADGQDSFFDAGKAMEYLAAAESDGITLPVRLDLAADSSVKILAEALKKCIEDNTQGKIEINVSLFDDDGYLQMGNYDLVLTMWGQNGDTPEEIISAIPGLTAARYENQDEIVKFLQDKQNSAFVEVHLLKEAMVLPIATEERNYMLSRIVPYTFHTDGRFKTVRVQEDPVHLTQWKWPSK